MKHPSCNTLACFFVYFESRYSVCMLLRRFSHLRTTRLVQVFKQIVAEFNLIVILIVENIHKVGKELYCHHLASPHSNTPKIWLLHQQICSNKPINFQE